MSEIFSIYLARHGETAWSVTGQHTGVTDLPLTERGERNAARLRERLAELVFAKVLTSPSQRAARTCELAGFGAATNLLAEVGAGVVTGVLTGVATGVAAGVSTGVSTTVGTGVDVVVASSGGFPELATRLRGAGRGRPGPGRYFRCPEPNP